MAQRSQPSRAQRQRERGRQTTARERQIYRETEKDRATERERSRQADRQRERKTRTQREDRPTNGEVCWCDIHDTCFRNPLVPGAPVTAGE